MAVLKYKDPVTGEIKMVGVGDTYNKAEIDEKLFEKAPMYTCGTDDLTAGESPLKTDTLYFVYE